MGSVEAAVHDWPGQPASHADWLRPATRALVRELRTRVILDLARLVGRDAEAARLRLLDVGSGDARFVHDVLPFAAPFGLDNSLGAAGLASQLVRRGRFLTGRAAALPFASETFDVVTVLDALERLPDRERPIAIREARRVLRPGGRMIVSARSGATPRGRQDTVRRFSRLFDDFSDVELVGLVRDFPTLRIWMAAPVAWLLFRWRVRTCDPQEAQVLVGTGLKR